MKQFLDRPPLKVVITGAEGQLGKDLIRAFAADHQLFAFSKRQLDVAETEQFLRIVKQIHPDIIIQAAAYTNVDGAELNPDIAYRTNAIGARNAAIAAQQTGAKLVYVSTDYVFNGNKGTPYTEFDIPAPTCVYGASKWAGEQLLQMFCNRFFIVRTAWLYGMHGKNFFHKIISQAQEQGGIRAAYDQFGSPTYTMDLVEFIGQLMTTEKYGIYHAANQGCCSRYDFVRKILELMGLGTVPVTPVAGSEFCLPAPRPVNSALEGKAVRLNGFSELRDWKSALAAFVKNDIRP